jgi:Protein of unknown function (DUF3379)
MNCLEFRRACLVEPHSSDAAFREHALECPACHGFLQEQLEQEQRLRAVLAVAPPAGIGARILLRHSFARRARWPLALAASVLLTLTVGLTGYFLSRPLSLEAEVLAHIHAEPDHLASHKPENPDKIANVLHSLRARLDGQAGEVRYAGVCDIGKRLGGHLVIQGQRGPVTVLLLPDQKLDRPLPIQAHGLAGVVLPAAGGAVAYVGMTGEPIDELAGRLKVHFHEPRA